MLDWIEMHAPFYSKQLACSFSLPLAHSILKLDRLNAYQCLLLCTKNCAQGSTHIMQLVQMNFYYASVLLMRLL